MGELFLYFPYMLTRLKNLVHPVGLLGLSFALIIPFLVYLAPHVGQKDLIGQLDLHLPFWLFCAQTVLGLSLLLALAKDFGQWVRPYVPEKAWLAGLGAVVLVAMAMSILWIEPRHRVQSDESIFLATAQNMFHRQVAGACDEGTFSLQGLDCIKTSQNFKAKGMAFLLAVGMPLLGTDLSWIFKAQLLLLLLTLPLFFMAIKVWLQDNFIALTATALLAAQPTLLFQFRSASVEPLYVFLSALALLVLKWAYERDTVRHWVLLALVMAFFAQTRQETAFALAGFLMVAIPKLLTHKDLRAPAFVASLSFFSLPVLLTISYYQGYNFQGGEFQAHGHFWEHLFSNWAILTQTPMQNGLLTNPFLSSFAWLTLLGTLTLVGLAVVEYRKRSSSKSPPPSLWLGTTLFLFLYHFQSFMILENVSGDFSIEINQRYILVMLPTMAFLGAVFIRQLLMVGAPFLMGLPRPSASGALAVGLALATAFVILANTARHSESFKANIMYNRNHLTTEESEIHQWLRQQPPKNRLFIYGRPWHFVGYGYSAKHYNTWMRLPANEIQSLIDKYQGEVYYIRGLDCWDSKTYHRKAVEKRIATVCDQFEDRYEYKTVHQTAITNNYLLTIAQLGAPKNYSAQGIFTPGVFQIFPEPQQIILSYALNTDGQRPWRVEFTLNGHPTLNKPYLAGQFLDTLPAPSIQSGYNIWNITITDTTQSKIIYHHSVQEFFALDGATPLQRLKPMEHSQEWGELHVDRSVLGNPLTIDGIRYDKGIGLHAASRTRYALQGKYARFSAIVGIDDEEMCSDGVQVQLFADNQLIADSGPIKPRTAHTFNVELNKAQELLIQSHSLGNISCDHVDIALPTLYPAR